MSIKKYNSLIEFKVSLEDVISRIDDTITGSLGVFVYDGLPSLPLFIIFRKESRKVEVYNSFYLTEPVSKMPNLHWETEFKSDNQGLFESDRWNMSELFLDYFKKRWEMEKEKLYEAGSQDVEPKDFIYAPKSAREKCTERFTEMK